LVPVFDGVDGYFKYGYSAGWVVFLGDFLFVVMRTSRGSDHSTERLGQLVTVGKQLVNEN
jgi:hypothetical protein